MDVLKQANDYGVQLYEEHQRFVKSFDARWRSDENVMLLLSAIALFTPERSNVLHKDVVKLEQVSIFTVYVFSHNGVNIFSVLYFLVFLSIFCFFIFRIHITFCSGDILKPFVQMVVSREVHTST